MAKDLYHAVRIILYAAIIVIIIIVLKQEQLNLSDEVKSWFRPANKGEQP